MPDPDATPPPDAVDAGDTSEADEVEAELRRDPEAPEADLLEQQSTVDAPHLRAAPRPVTRDPEVSEADLLEQSQAVPFDDDDR